MGLKRGRPPGPTKKKKDSNGNPIPKKTTKSYDKKMKDDLFNEWYSLGRMPINGFVRHLKNKLEIARFESPKNTFLGLDSIPVWTTIQSWQEKEDWIARADERDLKIRDVLETEAIAAKKQMMHNLTTAAEAQMTAQLTILDRADLGSLTSDEARRMIPVSLELGQDAIRQLKEALLLLPDVENTDPMKGRPELSTVISAFDKLIGGGASGELRLALAAKVGGNGDGDRKLPEGDIIDGELV